MLKNFLIFPVLYRQTNFSKGTAATDTTRLSSSIRNACDLRAGERQDDCKRAIDQFSSGVDPQLQVARNDGQIIACENLLDVNADAFDHSLRVANEVRDCLASRLVPDPGQHA